MKNFEIIINEEGLFINPNGFVETFMAEEGEESPIDQYFVTNVVKSHKGVSLDLMDWFQDGPEAQYQEECVYPIQPIDTVVPKYAILSAHTGTWAPSTEVCEGRNIVFVYEKYTSGAYELNIVNTAEIVKTADKTTFRQLGLAVFDEAFDYLECFSPYGASVSEMFDLSNLDEEEKYPEFGYTVYSELEIDEYDNVELKKYILESEEGLVLAVSGVPNLNWLIGLNKLVDGKLTSRYGDVFKTNISIEKGFDDLMKVSLEFLNDSTFVAFNCEHQYGGNIEITFHHISTGGTGEVYVSCLAWDGNNNKWFPVMKPFEGFSNVMLFYTLHGDDTKSIIACIPQEIDNTIVDFREIFWALYNKDGVKIESRSDYSDQITESAMVDLNDYERTETATDHVTFELARLFYGAYDNLEVHTYHMMDERGHMFSMVECASDDGTHIINPYNDVVYLECARKVFETFGVDIKIDPDWIRNTRQFTATTSIAESPTGTQITIHSEMFNTGDDYDHLAFKLGKYMPGFNTNWYELYDMKFKWARGINVAYSVLHYDPLHQKWETTSEVNEGLHMMFFFEQNGELQYLHPLMIDVFDGTVRHMYQPCAMINGQNISYTRSVTGRSLSTRRDTDEPMDPVISKWFHNADIRYIDNDVIRYYPTDEGFTVRCVIAETKKGAFESLTGEFNWLVCFDQLMSK